VKEGVSAFESELLQNLFCGGKGKHASSARGKQAEKGRIGFFVPCSFANCDQP
jgi:hypothetical protein